MVELSIGMKHLSMKKKRFAISLKPIQFLEEVLSLKKIKIEVLLG